MDREILFKAKRKDNGEWVEGFLLSDGMREPEHWFVGSIVIEPCKGTACDEWDIRGIALEEIEISSLCHFTGLTDKNGQKIWENDIVKHKDSQCFGTIRWYRGDYVGWCVDDVHDYEQQFTMDMFNECEVIGNIFNNSALLEV